MSKRKPKKIIRAVARWIEPGSPLIEGGTADHLINKTGVPWALMECGHLVRHHKHTIVTKSGRRDYRPRKMECKVCQMSMEATSNAFRTGLLDVQMGREPETEVEVYPDNVIPFPVGGRHGRRQGNE